MTGEVPTEKQAWEMRDEIPAGEVPREVKADGRLLAKSAFYPREKFLGLEENQQ
jgi:hypothetical protein